MVLSACSPLHLARLWPLEKKAVSLLKSLMDVVVGSPGPPWQLPTLAASALVSSHAAGKLCGHCGPALFFFFLFFSVMWTSCGEPFQKEPAILYPSRTVAQCNSPPPRPPAASQELMPGNWGVLSVSVKRGSPAWSKVTSHSGVTLRLFVLAGELHEDVLMPVRLKCLHNTICPGFLPANVQTNWEPLFRAQMLPIMKLIKKPKLQ